MHTGTHAHLHTYTQTHRGTGDRAEAHQPAWQKATLPIKLSILKLDRSGRRMDGGVAEPVAGCDGEPGTRKHWDQEWRRCRCQVCKHNEEIFGMTGREIKRALVAKEAKEEKERRAAAEKAAKVEAERAAAEKVAAVAEARAAAAAAAATAVPLFGGGFSSTLFGSTTPAVFGGFLPPPPTPFDWTVPAVPLAAPALSRLQQASVNPSVDGAEAGAAAKAAVPTFRCIGHWGLSASCGIPSCSREECHTPAARAKAVSAASAGAAAIASAKAAGLYRCFLETCGQPDCSKVAEAKKRQQARSRRSLRTFRKSHKFRRFHYILVLSFTSPIQIS
jgi:hypothetical protein